MSSLALYGYGVYGKRTSESFLRYWGGEHQVTAIFDRANAGKKDSDWDLTVLSPDQLWEEFGKGTFEKVMVCVNSGQEQSVIRKQLSEKGIPVFSPGSPEDFGKPEDFPQVKDPKITVSQKNYSFHVYKNMLGAVPDYDKLSIMLLFGENGKVNVDNQKKYMHWYEPLLLAYPFRLRDPQPERVFMKGEYCCIAKTYSFNYWHFTFEAADCAYLMEKAGFKGKYIFNDLPYARELLLIMGIAPERLIGTKELDYHKVYVFETLYDINPDGMKPMQCSAVVLPELGASVRKKLIRDENSPKKLFIKRLGVRKLLNGEDIALKNGFTVMIPENYSVLEQMNLFYNADIILSPHGANCTNHLYMRKGTVFVEFFSEKWHIWDINRSVCEANGVHYLEMEGKPCSDDDEDRVPDYTVDEEELQRVITEAERIFAGGTPDKKFTDLSKFHWKE